MASNKGSSSGGGGRSRGGRKFSIQEEVSLGRVAAGQKLAVLGSGGSPATQSLVEGGFLRVTKTFSAYGGNQDVRLGLTAKGRSALRGLRS
jgi:hypothetical protein